MRDPIEVLADVDLADAADQRVDQFSKGMKMRLNLARAMLHDPDLLFLDEPTTGQDPARARATRDLIRVLKARGKTIFLTTHNMAEAEEVCDRVGFLFEGRIAVTGTPDELRRTYRRAPDRSAGQGRRCRERPTPLRWKGLAATRRSSRSCAGESVVSIHTQEASLDDIFIKTAAARAP